MYRTIISINAGTMILQTILALIESILGIDSTAHCFLEKVMRSLNWANQRSLVWKGFRRNDLKQCELDRTSLTDSQYQALQQWCVLLPILGLYSSRSQFYSSLAATMRITKRIFIIGVFYVGFQLLRCYQ